MFGEASCVDRICPPSQRLPEECSEHGGKEGQAAQEGVRGGRGVVGSSCCCCWSQVGGEQVVAVRSHQSDAAASPVSSTAPLNLYLLLLLPPPAPHYHQDRISCSAKSSVAGALEMCGLPPVLGERRGLEEDVLVMTSKIRDQSDQALH